MNKKKYGQALSFTKIVLLILTIIVVFKFQDIQGLFANLISNNQTELKQACHYSQHKKPDFDPNHVKPISPQSLFNAWRCRSDYRAIGQIAIVDYNILLNIYRGTGNNELALGVGTFRADQKMGQNNYPLAGHNMDDGRSYFSPLYTAKVNDRLRAGTVIFLTDFDNVYFYKIINSKFVDANNLNLTFNQKKYVKSPVITLFTCDWTGIGRLYVKGKLTGVQSVRSCSNYVKHVFNFD